MDPEKYIKQLKKEHNKKFSSSLSDGNLEGKIIFSDDNRSFFQIHQVVSNEQIEGLPINEAVFYSACSREEIKKLLDVRNAEDYLLKLRADEIAENSRFHRVFLARKKTVKDWSITDYFKNSIFDDYVNLLPNSKYKKCKGVTSGFAFLKEPVGKCIKTKYENLILLSESLRYFLYYMNLFMLSPYFEVPPQDAMHSFMIAIRIMLENEALDFDIDQRGVLPDNIDYSLKRIIKYQLKFVVGHEYAHHILDHLNNAKVNECSISDVLPINRNPNRIKVYNHSQKNEFEADWYSIKNARFSPYEKAEVVNAAFLFFQALDLFHFVKEFFHPDSSGFKSHPEPINRLWKLRKRISKRHGYNNKDIEKSITNIESFKSYILKEVLPFQSELFEFYGSMYLPSYKHRNLIDRIDF